MFQLESAYTLGVQRTKISITQGSIKNHFAVPEVQLLSEVELLNPKLLTNEPLFTFRQNAFQFGNDPQHNLICPAANGHQPRVAEITRHRVLFNVPHTTVKL